MRMLYIVENKIKRLQNKIKWERIRENKIKCLQKIVTANSW